MKITGLELRAYRAERSPAIRNGLLTYDSATTCILEVKTDEGLSGTGLGVGVMHAGGERVMAAVAQVYAGMLEGAEALEHERLWNLMWQPKLLGRRGLEVRVQSMIDIALWDLKGKVSQLPLAKLLGGFRESVPCYVAGGYYEEGKDLAQLADEMREHLSVGVRAVKMKVGGAPLREDIRRVETVRAAIGPDVELLVDANGACTSASAMRLARAMEDFDIFWFEEPVMPDDYEGSTAVARASAIPVASGENESTKFGFRDLIERAGVGIINPDAEILGGITEFMKVAALAEARCIPIAPHGRADLHAHLVCAIPNGLMVEYYRDNVGPPRPLPAPRAAQSAQRVRQPTGTARPRHHPR